MYRPSLPFPIGIKAPSCTRTDRVPAFLTAVGLWPSPDATGRRVAVKHKVNHENSLLLSFSTDRLCPFAKLDCTTSGATGWVKDSLPEGGKQWPDCPCVHSFSQEDSSIRNFSSYLEAAKWKTMLPANVGRLLALALESTRRINCKPSHRACVLVCASLVAQQETQLKSQNHESMK